MLIRSLSEASQCALALNLSVILAGVRNYTETSQCVSVWFSMSDNASWLHIQLARQIQSATGTAAAAAAAAAAVAAAAMSPIVIMHARCRELSDSHWHRERCPSQLDGAASQI